MSEKGWIVLDRAMLDHWLWQKKPFSEGQAWIDLIMLANHKDQKFVRGGRLVEGKRGVVYRSMLSLSDRWGWDRKKTRRFLKRLEADQMVVLNDPTNGTTNDPTNGTVNGTTITLVNYDNFQNHGTTNDPTNRTTEFPKPPHQMGQRWDNDGTTMGQRLPTYNTYNNDNNIGYSKPLLYRTSEGRLVGSSKYLQGDPLPQPTTDQYDEIIRIWNDIPHTRNINGIRPMSPREENLRYVISTFGWQGLNDAIQKIRDSEYLQRIGDVKFDNYIASVDAIEKVLEGNYDQDYSNTQGGWDGELTIDGYSFDQDQRELSAVPVGNSYTGWQTNPKGSS